jgi:alkylation response protein AidB-like acyl-CoA dehydrogenase
MDVRLSADQQGLRDAAAKVVDRLGPKAVPEIGDPDRLEKLDVTLDECGWRELRSESEGGGPLASGVEVSLVAEELGRGLADAAFLGPTLAAELQRLAGAPPSDSLSTVALEVDLSGVRIVDKGEYGNREWPPSVAIDTRGSSTALLLIADGGRYRLAQTDLGGETSGPDLTRSSMVLNPPAPVSTVDGAKRKLTADDLARWTALGLSVTCADLVGIMRGAVQLSCEYAAGRRQFGAAIGSFQAVQHMLADAYVAMEGSRSVALHAAWAADALSAPDALAAASLAKAYCARASRNVCETAIQVHGGIGNTWECLAHVFLRRALLSGDILGGASASVARVLEHHGIGSRHGLQ